MFDGAIVCSLVISELIRENSMAPKQVLLAGMSRSFGKRQCVR